jgi:hypothetical protein
MMRSTGDRKSNACLKHALTRVSRCAIEMYYTEPLSEDIIRGNGVLDREGLKMSTGTEREIWRRASLAFYYRTMETREGRERLAGYKRFRRRAIRCGIWRSRPAGTRRDGGY